jgi:hypothetical protein
MNGGIYSSDEQQQQQQQQQQQEQALGPTFQQPRQQAAEQGWDSSSTSGGDPSGACSAPLAAANKASLGAGLLPRLAAAAGPGVLEEPQLLLVVGPVLSLAGYPPFHSRGAEIFHLGEAAAVTEQVVAAALARYCRVLQRHGA